MSKRSIRKKRHLFTRLAEIMRYLKERDREQERLVRKGVGVT